jgi:hypothetical protein
MITKRLNPLRARYSLMRFHLLGEPLLDCQHPGCNYLASVGLLCLYHWLERSAVRWE